MSGRSVLGRRRRSLASAFHTVRPSNRRRYQVAPWQRPAFLASLPPRGDPRRFQLIAESIRNNQDWIGHVPEERPADDWGTTTAVSEPFRVVTPEPDIEFLDPDDPQESDSEFVNHLDVTTSPRSPPRALTPAPDPVEAPATPPRPAPPPSMAAAPEADPVQAAVRSELARRARWRRFRRTPRWVRARIARSQRIAFPYRLYGTARFRRGTPESLQLFGPSYNDPSTTAEQKLMRLRTGFSGRGRYRKRRRKGAPRIIKYYRGRGLYGGAHRVYGRGGFWSDLWGHVKTPLLNAAQAGLTAYNPMLGKGFGALRSATGIGAYNVSTNDLVGGASNTFQAPTFGPVSDTGEISITHREYVGNIYAPSSTGFTNTTYPLNPGMEQTFKWLSQIASNYEEYEFVQLMFTFKSTVSDFQTTTGVVGQLLMTTQYNTDIQPFTTKEEMMTYHGSVSSKLTGNALAGVECDPSKLAGAPGKFVRFQGLNPNQDLKEFDLGRLNIAMMDVPTQLHDQAVGELWVSYTVKLRRPKVVTARGDALSMDRFAVVGPVATGASFFAKEDDSTVTRAMWDTLPSRNVLAPQNSIGCSLVCDGTTAITFASGSSVPTLPSGFTRILDTGGNTAGGVTNGVKLIFPATFSGDVEINYSVQTKAATGGTANFEMQRIIVGAVGNVAPLSDLVTGVPNLGEQGSGQDKSSAWSYGQQRTVGTETQGFEQMWNLRIRLRVSASTGGVDNAIVFAGDATMPNASSPAYNYILNADLCVSEINASFSRSSIDPRPNWVYADTRSLAQLQSLT